MAAVQDFARLLGGRLWLQELWLAARREYLSGDWGMELATLERDRAGMLVVDVCKEGCVFPLGNGGLSARVLSDLVLEDVFVGLVLLTIATSPKKGRGESGTFHRLASSGRSSSLSSYSSSNSLAVLRLGCHEPLLLILAIIGGDTT